MPNMTKDFTRLAGDIVVQRWARDDLRNEIADSVRERRAAVGQFLQDLRSIRVAGARQLRGELRIAQQERRTDSKQRFARFWHERDAVRQQLTADAAAVMRDMIAAGAAWRAVVQAEHRHRGEAFQRLAGSLNERLESYRADRRNARAAWHSGGHAVHGSWLSSTARSDSLKGGA